jgi:hypothetical protein
VAEVAGVAGVDGVAAAPAEPAANPADAACAPMPCMVGAAAPHDAEGATAGIGAVGSGVVCVRALAPVEAGEGVKA